LEPEQKMPRDVHLVGSVPMASAREVFETVGRALGPRLKRIPDGETGERADWITWADCRFQIDLVPAHSVIWLYLQDDLHAPLDPIYNAALKREIEKICQRLPHDQIAIQFDVASAVFARLERNDVSSYGKSKAETQATFARILIDLADHVPSDIELLFHFCYGDSNHRHVVEPTDMADMVEMANRLTEGVRRPIQLIHMPVPRGRSDDVYFAPLRNLKLKPQTELCLGLVHHTDGVPGTCKRLAAAEKVVKDFSIGTECGFGRRKPETIPELLRIHAEVAAQ
jgi:hypothetical protein